MANLAAPTSRGEADRGTRWTNLLNSPLLGFAPWIALSVLEGPGRIELAAAVALAMSLAFVLTDRLRGRSLKLLGCVDVVSFAALLIVGLLLSDDSRRWLETWFGEISNIILVVVVAGSMLARLPFTLQYAREEVDGVYWDNPVFLRINYLITGAWGLAFLVSAVAGFYGDAVLHNDNNLWTGWVIQIGADVLAARFTSWYPDYASAKALRAAGQPADKPESFASLLLPLTGYLAPVGILALCFDAGPYWIGVGLIIAGGVFSGWLRNRIRASEAAGDVPAAVAARPATRQPT
jgi:hypothetical protein